MTGLLLIAMLAAESPGETTLRPRVEQYWSLLEAGARSEAARLVSTGSLQRFVSRLEPPFRSPRLTSMVRVGSNRFRVEVRVRRFIGSGDFDWPVVEDWVFEEDWNVEIPDCRSDRRRMWSSPDAEVSAGTIAVQPDQLRLHFLSTRQRATVVVRNGTAETVAAVARVSRGQLAVSPSASAVAPGATGRFEVEFSGDTPSKNLHGELEVLLEKQGRLERHRVPVIYNYVSPAARALFGLDRDRMQSLAPGAMPQPVVGSARGIRPGGM